MRKLFCLAGACVLACLGRCASVPKVIVDADVGSSTDDLFALEVAALQHRAGALELAAVMVDRPGADNVAFTDAFLHHHGLDGVPIGTIADPVGKQRIFVPYASLVHSNAVDGAALLPRDPNRPGAVMDAVRLYRAVLADAGDKSVDICAIGFFTHLMRLLDTPADGFSDLTGSELVARKVRTLRIMAGSFDGALDHPEYNVWGDVPSARRIFSSWPTPIVCTPYEVGVRVYYPHTECRADFPESHPIAATYRHWNPDGTHSKAQLMWDPMTVLGLVDEMKGLGIFGRSAPGVVDVDKEGYTTFRADPAGRTVVQTITLAKALEVRRGLRALGGAKGRAPVSVGATVRVAEVASAPREGEAGEFLVLTNISATASADLGGVRVACSQPEEAIAVDVALPAGTVLPPMGALRLTRAAHWPSAALPDKALNVVLYAANGDVLCEAFVDARWWNGACRGTGRHFVAREFGPLVLEASQWAPSAADPADAVSRRVTILHTNDTHAHIDDGSVAFSAIACEKARLLARGENVILADAGDFVQGTALGGFDEGRTVVDIMNAAGYDVATLGNHEFDYGIPAMHRNVARAKFRMTSCNFISRTGPLDPGRLVLPPYAVVTSGTVRVAFVGVTTPTALVSAKPSTFLDPTGTYRAYDFLAGERGDALYAAVQRSVDRAAQEADYVVVLGHLGVSPESAGYMSTDVIAHTTNFVAFIDGHSHSEYTGRRVRNAAGKEVILTQSGSYLGVLGYLTLEDGQCVSAGTVYPRGERSVAVERLERDLAAAVERQLGVRVAVAPKALCSYVPGTPRRLARSQDCGAGDFAADAAWWYANEKAGLACDFALVNGGNVRADIPAGDVTLKTLRTVQPFGGSLGVVEANGRQVLDALEFGAQVVGEGESGGFLQVAGLRYGIDKSVKSALRIDATGNWTAGPSNGVYRVYGAEVYDRATGAWRPLDLNAVYRVVGGAFTLVEGGDGFSMFRSAKRIENSLVQDYVSLAEYAKAFGRNADGVPVLSSDQSPLRGLAGYGISYERPQGAGRIAVVDRK
ncbi:MAG: 5'-nucleotidase C-terminal domain-containing protein [Kiritimatiellae bacterium]|nr:5'-nucleotidase C-terminal domain-containing protein [Kiritimatiellia bacterium]